MKKTITGMAIAAMVIFSATAAEAQSQARATAGGWSDKANCLNNYGDCGWCVTDAMQNYSENQMGITMTVLSPHRILISYERALVQGDDATITLGTGVQVPADICAALGASSITILPGDYAPDYSVNNYGNYIVNADIAQ